MSNGKSGRKKSGKVIASIVVIIAALFGINLHFILDWSSTQQNPTNTSQPIVQNQTQQQIQPVEGELTLTMIDVGQADSFFFFQNGETALVDCGTRSTGEDVVEYLQSQNIEKIDYVFGTHPHDDHMGGMYDVITNIEVGKIIIPEVESGKVTANWYMQLMQELSSGDYEVEYVELGTVYSLGDATMKVIGPISESSDNLNNYSTVLKVSFGEMDIIMSGDAEKEVERQILESGENIKAEIFKVGHHGSDTSNTEEFLDAINPKYGLISTKLGNKYEHPIESVMKALEERDIEVYRTDENGTVVATITANDVTFSCEPGDYLSGIELEKRSTK